MKLLELFSGTGSVGKVFKESGWTVVSLDRDMDADIKTDIMDWDYKAMFEPGSFDVLWTSPPCTEYSVAKTVGVRKITEANQVVQRTLDIIDYFQPKFWFLENPQTGMLKSQPMMQDKPFTDVDYCRYGMPYRKRTRIWNNLTNWTSQPLCKRDCDSMLDNKKRHKQIAQRGPAANDQDGRQCWRQDELYRIPAPLIQEIVNALEYNFR